MTIAVNSEGKVIYYDAEAATWVPAQVATNGDSHVAFDGNAWVPVTLPKKEQPAAPGLVPVKLPVLGEPSIIDTVKHLATTPTRALENLQAASRPVVTEEDQFRQNQAMDRLTGSSLDAAAFSPMTRAAPVLKPAPKPAMPKIPPPVPPSADPLMSAAGNINVQIPRVLATDSVPVQRVASSVSQMPMVGEPLVAAARRTTEGLGTAAERVAGELGAGSAEIAGAAATKDIAAFIKNTSRNEESAAHEAVRGMIQPNVITPLVNTADALVAINARRANAMMGESPIGALVKKAIDSPGLNYEGIKDLRSSVGPKVVRDLVQRGFDATEVRQLYGALSKDLESAVGRAGGLEALSAWKAANATSVKIKAQQDKLAEIIGMKGEVTAEKVYDRIIAKASSKQRADIHGLMLARKAVGDKAWNEIGSAVIANMGRDAQGAFSPDRFLGPSGYSRLTPKAREILFTAEHRKALDSIATVSNSIKDKIGAFENRSRTGGTLMGAAGLTGLYAEPMTTMAAALGGHVIARYLAHPATAKAVAQVVQAQRNAIIMPGPAATRALEASVRQLLASASAAGLPTKPTDASVVGR